MHMHTAVGVLRALGIVPLRDSIVQNDPQRALCGTGPALALLLVCYRPRTAQGNGRNLQDDNFHAISHFLTTTHFFRGLRGSSTDRKNPVSPACLEERIRALSHEL